MKAGISNQSIQFYNINEKLYDMIRGPSHNVCAMYNSIICQYESDDRGEYESDDRGEDESDDRGADGGEWRG